MAFASNASCHDRILHEALTASPDPLHLTLVFNVSHPTALDTPTPRNASSTTSSNRPMHTTMTLRIDRAGVGAGRCGAPLLTGRHWWSCPNY